MSSQSSQTWLWSRSQTWLMSPMSSQGSKTWQNIDQHKSSPKSALSVIGVRQHERVQMSRTLFCYS